MIRRVGRWIRARRYRQVLAGVAIVVLGGLGHFVAVRVTAGARRVRIVHEPGVASSTSPWPTVRIATFNIAHGRGLAEPGASGGSEEGRWRRLQALGRKLAEVNADVVVLNEVDFDASWSHGVNQAAVIAESAGYPYRLEQRNIDAAVPLFCMKFGNAVLSRYPIIDAVPIEYPDREKWQTIVAGKKRGAVCTIAPPDGEPFAVVAIHLDHSRPDVRSATAEALVQACQGVAHPIVMAGDFNATLPGYASPSGPVPTKTAVSAVLAGGLVAKDPVLTPATEACTFPSQRPDRTLDWILAPPSWTFVGHEVIRTDLTDHCLVVATLRADGVASAQDTEQRSTQRGHH